MTRNNLLSMPLRLMVLLCAAMICLPAVCGGCGISRDSADHHAVIMNGVADTLNAQGIPTNPAEQRQFLGTIENERRTAVNQSDAVHFRKPSYPNKAKLPTTLPAPGSPWVPQDDVPAAKP